MKIKTVGQLAFEATQPKPITHKDIIIAATWAAKTDFLAMKHDRGEQYAEDRARHMNIGAFRAFEWLEKNGWEIRKR